MLFIIWLLVLEPVRPAYEYIAEWMNAGLAGPGQ